MVGINIFAFDEGSWSGDVPLLFRNAIVWLGGAWLRSAPTAGKLAPGESVSINFTAVADNLEPKSDCASYAISGDPDGPIELDACIEVMRPEAELWHGTTAVPIGATVDLGPALADEPTKPSCVLRMENQGDYDLEMPGMVTPANFQLTETLATPIAPGGSDTFGLGLNTSSSGVHSGTVSIDTNDQNEDPYTFIVEARIIPVGEIVWVDFSTGAGGDGSYTWPMQSLLDAIARGTSGAVIRMKPGVTPEPFSEPLVLNTPVRLEAPEGAVRIGANE